MVFTPQQQVAGTQDIKSDPNHPVEVFFGGANLTNIREMILASGVTIYPEDKVEAFPDPALGLGSEITVTRATPVLVIDAKKSFTYRTWQTNIDDLIKEKNIELLGKDSVEPAVSTSIKYAMKITITRVAEVEVTEKETIDHKLVKKNAVDLEKGQTEIQTKGVDGTKEVVYLVKRVDGEEVSRKVQSTSVTKEPVTEVQIIGIGPKLAKSGPYKDIINAAAKKYLINGTALMCLMLKESNGHADSGYPGGQYQGLFQYDPQLWSSASSEAGYGGYAITNPTAQIFTTAFQIVVHKESRRWPPYASCANK